MRLLLTMTTLSIVIAFVSGCSKRLEKQGLSFSGETSAEHVRLLVDETWVDGSGTRRVKQEIFDSVFEIIDEADDFLLLDFFLVNDFLYQPGPGMRPLSRELIDKLLVKRSTDPEVRIIFITDPINTVYGSVESAHFKALQEAGVEVVWTELDRLRDSNPLYSKPWRLFFRPWGVGPGETVDNPLGDGRISMRSMLKLLNFKANHRKVVVSDKSLLVTSANPHSASSAHWNVALRIDGAGTELGCESESAILRLSGKAGVLPPEGVAMNVPGEPEPCRVALLTEGAIKAKLLALLGWIEPGTRIDLSMFYLSDRTVINALLKAREDGADIRIILDPNKDAFGRTKNGIPNRQSAFKLAEAGILVRWADTHGEQFHVKMIYVEHPNQTATLLLGSCNYTRRNMDNFNAECDLAVTAPLGDAAMVRARGVFDRWWINPDDRTYTADYSTYEDPSPRRRFRAYLMEITGLSSF